MTSAESKSFNSRALVLIALHVLLLIYSFTSFFSKNAAAQPVMSPAFIGLYFGMLVTLGIYAVGWQQILKHLPLTVAFANKAITVVWGIVWGVLFFGETLNWYMVAGAAAVMAGVVLFSIADGEEQAAARAQEEQAAAREVEERAAADVPQEEIAASASAGQAEASQNAARNAGVGDGAKGEDA